jgi:hypothetical protein
MKGSVLTFGDIAVANIPQLQGTCLSVGLRAWQLTLCAAPDKPPTLFVAPGELTTLLVALIDTNEKLPWTNPRRQRQSSPTEVHSQLKNHENMAVLHNSQP